MPHIHERHPGLEGGARDQTTNPTEAYEYNDPLPPATGRPRRLILTLCEVRVRADG